jgi:outer membrane protein OmpA-like peptidoglycan-associated protein
MKAHNHIFIFSLLLCLTSTLSAQKSDKVTVQIKNEDAINTPGLEFSPTFYEDGIVFISTNDAGLKKAKEKPAKPGKKSKKESEQKNDDVFQYPETMSILRSRRNAEGALSAPEPFAKELTSINNEGPVCFDRTAETVYFSSNSTEKGKDKFAKDKIQHTKIYASKKVNGTWSEPTPLPFNNDEFDDFHPAISIDGDKLFFASNRPGGFGSTDIYVAYKVGESWSEPVNLGPGVNTKGREAFPFIHADNTLYFASDGITGGSGGFDMYYVIPEGTQWTKPINMGAPFNTAGDDFGLIVDLNKINGYFSSNGASGKGGDEIFNFHTENGNLDDYLLQNNRVPDRNLDLKLTVTDKAKGNPVSAAEVHILNYDANNVIGRDESGNLITLQNINGQDVLKSMPPDKGINGITDARGHFSSDMKPGNYVIIITKKGYQTKQIRLPISKPGNEVTAQLEKPQASAGKVEWNPSMFNYVTNAPLGGAMLVLTNDATGKQDTVIADANGQVDYYLDPNAHYKVDIYQGGRLVGSTEVDTHNAQPGQVLNQNVSIAPMLPGTAIEMPNIYYNFNDATLRPDARKDLDLVVALMKQQPSISVELASHTDCRGTSEYNQELSQRRANGVVEYLINQGIERKRLRPVGYGESVPRNKCTDGVDCTEEEHARNRRTEVKVLTGMEGSSMVYVDGKMNNASTAPPVTPDKKPTAEPSPTPVASNVTVTNGEKSAYYVITGSFLMENRAVSRVEVMKKAGHADAQIVRFTGSPFYSVSLGKFNSRKEAEGLKQQLDKESIDCFVRAGN